MGITFLILGILKASPPVPEEVRRRQALIAKLCVQRHHAHETPRVSWNHSGRRGCEQAETGPTQLPAVDP